ncbi:MAG: SIR2 family protein [Pseudomonadota bacterium]
MNPSSFADIIAALDQGTVIPYLGPGVLRGVTDTVSGTPIPAESQDLILAMTGGQPMAPRLMYEFPRAAMHMENKKGRSFLERFLNTTYGERTWSASEFHQWLAARRLPYVIDCNRDTQLQQLYADRDHTLVLGASRLTGTHYRFDLHEFRDGAYRHITQNEVNPDLPVLFKPMGSPLPKPSYVASDADFVDYITELMGGFAVPAWLKQYRQQKRYLFLGMRFNRDTERMVMSDLIYDAADHAGWAFIPEPNAKEARFCARKNIQIVEADWTDLLAGTVPVAAQVA